MIAAVPLTWLQLRREKTRLAMAILGVTFAVVLVFMQLGFRDALFDGSVRYHDAFHYDLAMISPKTDFIVRPEGFSRRRLVQALGVEGVESVSAVYLGKAVWRNPLSPQESRTVYVVGFDPSERVLRLPSVEAAQQKLLMPDTVLFDAHSREEFGPIAELYGRRGAFSTEIGNRTVEIGGLFELGTSFGIDASIVTSDLNFRRLFPNRQAGKIDLGLVRLAAGADLEEARLRLLDAIPKDVIVLTRRAFVQREVDYWSSATPIGYIFSFGAIIGLTVGAIIVYQILFADVSDHLSEYATLKAMGYTHGYLVRVVLKESVILGALGFLPGALASAYLYGVTRDATQLPMALTVELALMVLGLTIAMCAFSGMLALRKLRGIDPAEVF
ncbi:MAG: ABC transporter permease DevC [Myxococcota bacterium]|nr:ABC transporter permease DevC [Myxococcota bacterium]